MKVHHRANKKIPVFLSAALLASAVTTTRANAEEVIYVFQEESFLEGDCEELFDDGTSMLNESSEQIVYPGGSQHDACCGYREAQPEIPCDHNCVDADGDGIIDHCPECAFRPAVLGNPCTCGMGEVNDGRQDETVNVQTETVESTGFSISTVTPEPITVSELTATPEPTETPESTIIPRPTEMPEATISPTAPPEPTEIPEPTVTPEPT
ncbi:MAG: hypothetical protein Q4D16_02430, partial [Eubacteriales bacterium]|nr:hypothetical protein [Eubacteriales bacterium]